MGGKAGYRLTRQKIAGPNTAGGGRKLLATTQRASSDCNTWSLAFHHLAADLAAFIGIGVDVGVP
jgi:hypothetical protein